MWKAMLVVSAVAVAAYDFDPHDQNEFVDSPDDDVPAVTLRPVQVSDFTSVGTSTKDVEGEVEKLLGQEVFHYEDPATTPPPTAVSETWVVQADIEVKENIPKRNQKRERNIASEYNHEDPITAAPVSQSFLASPEPTRTSISRSDFSRRPKLRTRSFRHWTTDAEVVYSVLVPWEAEHPRMQRVQPGVIERLVGAHEIVRHETLPTRAEYNLGATRPRPGLAYAEYSKQTTPDDARRYLLTLPARLTSTNTRPPRPTPTTLVLTTSSKFTRKTRKHPNCTDSYYECLALCFDNRGYKVSCPWDTRPPRPEPARINFTGFFWALTSPMFEWDTSQLLANFKKQILEKGYRDCKCTTRSTTTTTPLEPIYYDDMVSNKTGHIVAKCWVCGLRDYGIPRNTFCADNFDGNSNSEAISEKNSYRKYCRYMDEIPLWFNRSDPFSVWGMWTGGCTKRWIDLSGLYTQRACRSTKHPATGEHFLSKRMSMLELGLRDERSACVVSPVATLVPFSRAVSLFARIHVCVCVGSFCNHAPRRDSSIYVSIMISLLGLRYNRKI